ncbi:MAG: aminopeptidase N [Candidatus Melainabacteria bacterium RIFOXYA12_FULL_32_12]|nr:MAG: aminopeptidase N [Candidatus Melainabacteria bacterium RIFOXYA2_FULL_32_9]OGI27961.1 MAG: aminopeptidase N [Candidatus Melainabacteria bacterium RIFOXYA12_FULL_32_12]
MNNKNNRAALNPGPVFGSQKPTELHLKDYTPPSHLIDKTDLTFELLAEDNVVVSSKLKVRPNPISKDSPNTIKLNGAPESAPEGSKTPTMELLEVKVNGRVLSKDEYTREDDELILKNLPNSEFTLETKTRINPKENRSLNGLYTSGGKFVTQCEPEGFRNMTFYLDRSDVMSEFTTTIVADKGKYPQLLSNGNPGKRTITEDGREKITWHDPFKKPSYLFALVAGDLAVKEDTFRTKSGRDVKIQIFVDKGDENKTDHAMKSIKDAMKWDEERFGREYDLDLFQIVATNDFNFGAMENKGLNIFNSSAILADPQTATDSRYEYVQGTPGHEYFHNWTGNRVTLQKPFDLTLKEGLTVFRDQEFTSDLNSREVKRIDDVTYMRTNQFPEDASAMAHPIRPASVGSIENFYTPTVYQKGAEIIRMIHTMLGEKDFRKGMDLYFDRHDGQAVTTEDFIKAMEDASGKDFSQFEKTWYNQAGTPTLDVKDSYDPETKEYKLTVKQSTPPTPGQPTKEPFHIPIRVGLLDSKGNDIPLQLDESQADLLTNGDILNLKNDETTFVFKNVPEKPIPSILRNWSAPVKLNYDYNRDDLTFLMAKDNDGFNRWEAGQKLGIDVLKELIEAHQNGKPRKVDDHLIKAFQGVLEDKELDPALAARTLMLPSTSYLSELYPDGKVDIDAIFAARKQAKKEIGKALEPMLLKRFNESCSTENRAYEWNKEDAGQRAIKNTVLNYLVTANPEKYLNLAIEQFDRANNMTDSRAALGIILDHADEKTRTEKLNSFYQKNKDNRLAIDQWFADQAFADRPDVLDNVKTLLKHEAYDAKNPNCVRSLVGGFASNTKHFHNIDGSGYKFLANQIIEIDKFNPMLAAGLSKRLSTPHRFDNKRQELIKEQLERIRDNVNSNNVKEIVSKSLDLLSAKQTEGTSN